jgi:predicted nucleotidyltransferase
MRLDIQIIQFIKKAISEKIPESTVYLFGSRTRDDAFGGDIDLMIITHNLIEKKIIRTIRIEFFKKFGWRKIDLVNFTYDDQSIFRELIKPNAIKL